MAGGRITQRKRWEGHLPLRSCPWFRSHPAHIPSHPTSCPHIYLGQIPAAQLQTRPVRRIYMKLSYSWNPHMQPQMKYKRPKLLTHCCSGVGHTIQKSTNPYWTKGHTNCQESSPQLWQKLPAWKEFTSAARSTDHKDQNAKEETETKRGNTLPTKKISEISTVVVLM